MSASGNCIITPGHTFADNTPITAADLNAAANPVVQVADQSIGSDQIVRSELITLLGADIAGYNYLDNGGFYENRWINGTSGSCPVGSKTILADKWWTNPAGAAVTAARVVTGPDVKTLHALKITGASSVTTVDIGQDIPRRLATRLQTASVVVSFYLYNNTGADVTPSLLINTANVADTFTVGAVTNVYNQAASEAVANQTWKKFTFVINASNTGTYGGFVRGAQFIIRLPDLALNAPGKDLTLSQVKLEVNPDGLATEFIPQREFPSDEYYSAQQTVNANLTALTTHVTEMAIPAIYERFLAQRQTASIVTLSFRNALLSDGTYTKSFSNTTTDINISSSGAAGLDTGTVANGNWYFIWLIGKSDGTKSAIFSLSSTSPTLPSGYTYKALVAECYYTGGAIRDFSTNGKRVEQDPVTISAALTNTLTAVSLGTAAVPSGSPGVMAVRGYVTCPTSPTEARVLQVSGSGNASQVTVCPANSGTALGGIQVAVPFQSGLKYAQNSIYVAIDSSRTCNIVITGYDRW